MLNKNALLLHPAAKKGDFAITVGTDGSRFGYNNGKLGGSRFGAISRVPYWFSGGNRYSLGALFYKDGDTFVAYGYTQGGSGPSVSEVRWLCNGGSASIALPGSFGMAGTSGDVFSLSKSVGKTLQVFCDPKPAGYL